MHPKSLKKSMILLQIIILLDLAVFVISIDDNVKREEPAELPRVPLVADGLSTAFLGK
jgi:hypothetical protein